MTVAAGTGRLWAVLGRLDRLLAAAVRVAGEEPGRLPADDPYRGLYITEAEVARLLQRAPGLPRLWVGEEDAEGWALLPDDDPAARLRRVFGLSGFELDAVAVALAVEIDPKYERLFAWLQDDATRRRPTAGLVLDLLCRSAEERLDRRRAFDDDAPLLARGLLHLGGDESAGTPRLGRSIRLDEAVVRHLLGQPATDARLVHLCAWHAPALDLGRVPVPARTRALLAEVVESAAGRGARIALHLHGPAGVGQREIAEAVAHGLRAPLVVAHLERLPRDGTAESALRLLGLEAALRGAVVYLDGIAALPADGRPDVELALSVLLDGPVHVVAATHGSGEPEAMADPVCLDLGEPDVAARRAWWRDRIAAAGLDPASADLDCLASRFRLNLDQIAEAVRAASRPARRPDVAAPAGAATTDALMARARAVSSRDLQALARTVTPVRTWRDLVLPAETLAQLRELCDRVARRSRVLESWGFADRLPEGVGTTALFAGPPGTGKTLAAEVVAHALGLNLYCIDLSAVVSKYIGDTEKNLARVFQAAERSNAVLLFDEADALFGKRSAVRDAHDRYANIEISYLLQRMEQYDGVAVLATNLAQNMDDAFVRRLAFTVAFPFPDEDLRRRLWTAVWPAATPVGADVDPAWLARRFKLSGGSIKNVALAAAHLVEEHEAAVTLDHVLRAVRREYQKMGKTPSDDELGRVHRA